MPAHTNKKIFAPVTLSQPFFSVKSLNRLTYDTPFFLFDLDQVATNYHEIKGALKGAKIFYALKCNSDPEIVRVLRKEGSQFEIASFQELQQLTDLGVPPGEVIYSNPVKPWQHVQQAAQAGVTHFSFDSFAELKKIAKFAPGANVYARLIVNDFSSRFPLSRKFGVPPGEVVGLMRRARRLKLNPMGLTFHVGSQQTQPSAWESAIRVCGSLMSELAQHDIKLQMLNIGGGFPAQYDQYVPPLARIARAINLAVKRHLPYPVEIWAEPGRYIAANAGLAAASIIAREERAGETWLYADLGAFNGMMEALEVPGGLPYPCFSSRRGSTARDPHLFTVTGPTCDACDALYYGVPLNENVTEGDRLYIAYAGAYTLGYASTFNGFPVPSTYYVPRV
jgi:ornithine decarboxylase